MRKGYKQTHREMHKLLVLPIYLPFYRSVFSAGFPRSQRSIIQSKYQWLTTWSWTIKLAQTTSTKSLWKSRFTTGKLFAVFLYLHLNWSCDAFWHCGHDGNTFTFVCEIGAFGWASDKCCAWVFGHLVKEISVTLCANIKDSQSTLIWLLF